MMREVRNSTSGLLSPPSFCKALLKPTHAQECTIYQGQGCTTGVNQDLFTQDPKPTDHQVKGSKSKVQTLQSHSVDTLVAEAGFSHT